VVMAASAPAMFASGGTFDIYLDDINSDAIYSGTINTTMQMASAETFVIPLDGQSGVHKFIAVYKSAKEGSPVGTLMSWTFVP